MKKLVVLFLLVSMTSFAYAGQKYNPMSREWETVKDSDELRYNPQERTWSYEDKDSQLEYNPHERRWDWGEKEDNDR